MRTRVRTRSTPLSIWILRSLSGRSRKRTPPRRKSRVEASQRRPWASRDAAKLENVKFTSNGQSGAAKRQEKEFPYQWPSKILLKSPRSQAERRAKSCSRTEFGAAQGVEGGIV